jgi:H+/Cl- antiporter ClcA/CBS domain-containing protein
VTAPAAATSLVRSVRTRVRDADHLRKWILLGAVIGVISGLGAVAFFLALELATKVLLGGLAGFVPASPAGEGGNPITDAARPWAIPLVVALGGLLSGLIVFKLAPEAEGHGTDAAIASFHHGARRVRARIPLIKLVSSAITIGSGGSGGREGPTAQIGAGFGSLLARWLDLDARDARIAVATGMGAGIGAIFRAPLGGAVLAAEIPYQDDLEADALIPGFVASIVAFSIFGALVSFAPIFGTVGSAGFTDPRQLVYYALIGLVAGTVGRLYITSFYGFTRWFGRWPVSRIVRPAIAGFAVGCIGLVLPGALGTGYGWVQAGLDRQTLLGLPLWVVLALPFAKILATSLSIGSGGSGGIFGPGMVIGGLLGAGVWRLLEGVAPAVPQDPSGFVIVAMMALFGSIAHAPLAVMLMVAEMTGNLTMLAPAMLAIGIAMMVVGPRSIYRSQLRNRSESPAHQFRFAMPLLASIPAGDAARSPRLVLAVGDRVGEAVQRLRDAGLPGAPVLERDGQLRGSVELSVLEQRPPEGRVGDAADDTTSVSADDPLDDVLAALAETHRAWVPVVSPSGLAGVLSAGDVMAAYRAALAANVRRVRTVSAAGALVEVDVPARSPLAGRTVAAVAWPRDTILVTIQRDGRVIVPRGDAELREGDRLTVFSTGEGRAPLEALVGGTPTPIAADGEEPAISA